MSKLEQFHREFHDEKFRRKGLFVPKCFGPYTPTRNSFVSFVTHWVGSEKKVSCFVTHWVQPKSAIDLFFSNEAVHDCQHFLPVLISWIMSSKICVSKSEATASSFNSFARQADSFVSLLELCVFCTCCKVMWV
jgi:hypothetical protein